MAAAATDSVTPASTAAASRRAALRSPKGAVALALGGLLILTLLGYLWYLRKGGLYSDDWSLIAELKHRPDGGGWWDGVQSMWDRGKYRPLSVAYYPIVFGLLGTHATLELIWSLLVTFAFVGLLFGVLRRVGMPTIHAFAVAALVLVAPMGDAVVLWPSATPIRLAGALYLCGLLLALGALREPDVRRSRRRHAAALVLYLAAIWTYELTAALTAAGLLVYLAVAPPRRALKHWAADMVVAVLAMAWTLSQTPKKVMTLQQELDHARMITHQLWDMYGGVAGPAWLPGHLAAVLTIIAGAGGVVLVVLMWRRGLGGEGAKEARRWVITGAIAFVYVMAAYVVFVPADFYYSPAAVNFGNRVNGVGVAPLVLLAYSAVMVIATLVLVRRPQWLRAATALAAVYAVGMFVHHNNALRDHQKLYVSAYEQERAVLDRLQRVAPDPPKGSFILTTSVAPTVARDLPVFYATWDLEGAVRGLYDDGSLTAFNAYTGLECRADGIAHLGGVAPYGKLIVVDARYDNAWAVKDAQQCINMVAFLSKPA